MSPDELKAIHVFLDLREPPNVIVARGSFLNHVLNTKNYDEAKTYTVDQDGNTDVIYE